jgi:hypothetical protein
MENDTIKMYHNFHNQDSIGVIINIKDIVSVIINNRIIYLVKTDLFTGFRKADYDKIYLIIFSKCHKYIIDIQKYMDYYVKTNMLLTEIIYYFPETQTDTCPIDPNFHRHYLLIDESENLYAKHVDIKTNKTLMIPPHKFVDYILSATTYGFNMKEHMLSLIENQNTNEWTNGLQTQRYKTYIFYYNTPLTEHKEFLNSEQIITDKLNKNQIKNMKLKETETSEQIHNIVKRRNNEALPQYFIIERDNTIKEKNTNLEHNKYINTDFKNISNAIYITRENMK